MIMFKQIIIIFFGKGIHLALTLLLSAKDELSHVSAFFPEFFKLLTWLIMDYENVIFWI